MDASFDLEFDLECMREALRLAAEGVCVTTPNPSIGCVLARDGRVLAGGRTQRPGGHHAEAQALANATGDLRGATAYVTLEPCSHFGRTPPCADALIAAGISRVVVACDDPHPQVAGDGIARLRAAGITVETGLLADEALALNPGFFKRFTRGLPYVRLKLAASLDGRTAMPDGSSQWITGAQARADVQLLRARSCAIVTGVDSILADDSRLTVRANELPGSLDFEPPLRVVLDSRLRTPADARVLQGPPALIVTAGPTDPLPNADVVALPGPDGRVDLRALLAELAARDFNEVLFECGARLAGSVLAAGLVDEVVTYIAGVLLGHAARPLVQLAPVSLDAAPRLALLDSTVIGADVRLRWRTTSTMASSNE